MFPKYHLFFGIIFASILFLIFSEVNLIAFFIIIASTFFIDIDHYLFYAFKKKDLNPKRAIKWFFSKGNKYRNLKREKRNKTYICFCFFHGFEIVLLFLILGLFIWKYFLFISIGFFFHLLLDVIYGIKYNDRFDRISLIWDFFKLRKLKRLE